jgi:DNA topoisomerase-2
MSLEYRVCGSHIEHVLLRPEIYIGSVITKKQVDWVYDIPSGKMVQKEIMLNPGLVKIIFEVIDNAVDNSKRSNNPTTTIKVDMDDRTVVVSNDGHGIPIEKADIGNGINEFIPTTIFGVPMSGSNFHESRDGTIGMNGLGVKLTNILSTEFKVICINDNTKFKQVWTNHMKNRGKEVLAKAPSKPTFSTSVSFTPDISYFHNDTNECNITKLSDIFDIILTRLLTISVSHPNPISIYFKGKQIKCKGLKAFMKMFTDDRTFYDNVPGTNFEYGVTLSNTGSFEHQSFVNCQRTTSDKSSHTKYVTSKVCLAIAEHLKKKGSGKMKLSSNIIASHLHVFVNIHMSNPKFSSQTKEELTSNIPVKEYPIDIAKVLGIIKKSGLLAKLETLLETKVLNNVQTALNTVSKKTTINIPKLDDAHDAGTKHSAGTMLFLVEGDSAKTMVSTGMTVIGRKKYGVFPLKGKVLNVIGTAPKKLAGNNEIVNIMKIVGLNFNKTYDTEAERQTLRYGRLCTLCDADVDGYHITGLLVTFFNHFWPALLQNGFLKRFVTPILKITKGRVTHGFFTMSDYTTFANNNDMGGWFVKHLKGLGTSRKEETLEYFENMEQCHLKNFQYSDTTAVLIGNIFDPKQSNWRKEWLSSSLTTSRLDYNEKTMPISKFLMTEMYDYSSYNIKRAIPSAIDGLKVSQRKVICTCLFKFSNPSTPTIKVAQLASFVAAQTNYAHGEVSLQNTIVNMAQTFSGSNNIPYLFEDGAFGTRISNGSDAASPRYIFTKMTDMARNIITETSPAVLTYITEENIVVEPEFYVPTLPMVLVNGSNGIATGFRSLVPLFNPDDIEHNIRCKFDSDMTPIQLLPWYGDTYSTNDKTVNVDGQWIFEGTIKKGTIADTLVISELPIGVAIDDYKDNVLVKMVENGIITRFVVDHISENKPRFVIYGYSNADVDLIERFKLRNTMTQKCMNLLDLNGHVKNFNSPEQVLDYWFDVRTDYVKRSHTNKCNGMKESISDIQHKLNFISAVVNNQLEIRNVSKASIVTDMMDNLHIPNELCLKFLQIAIVSITKERYLSLVNELDQMKNKLSVYEKLTVKSIILQEMGWYKKPDIIERKRKLEPITTNSNKKSKK